MEGWKPIQMCKDNNGVEFEELVREFEKKVYNISYSITENKDDALDVSQEVFLKVYRRIHTFRGDSSIATWLYRITINTCWDYLKKRNKQKSNYTNCFNDEKHTLINAEGVDDWKTPEDIHDVKELQAIVREAINHLTDDQRVVVVLRDLQQLSYNEIAEILNCSLGLVKSRLSRGRTKLREILTNSQEYREYLGEGFYYERKDREES
ncbi:RNA polymerase sigma factor [Alkaliphilus serpentinus]|uniref:Sigma-70 family RNA polymerase sigma factor n=1 Tax=Alkaliphilus serpentinus TaxID=1482731 RepID=A0A833M8T4_9FIRM|nr:sigma-70 family RNA polymerase sigma factor [Alkaliphilus serpentinus]KAB3527267.1 sigma-70 family RNA polymerase sigma factor [Alkaliphilus serpentinus]